MEVEIKSFAECIAQRHQNQPEFIQAVTEVAESLVPFIETHPIYSRHNVLEYMTEPERIVIFRVPWINDHGEVEINRGYRVQMSSAIGPYKGGLRFHPSVNLSILKFLAFEQVLKNSLTGLPMGGAKGGSDFDPKGKSDMEVMKFCQSFMTELCKYIGPDTDVPAGDIGVGGREIGYLFGQYKRIKTEFTGVLTGKGMPFGGSLIRPEATGYGLIYFVEEMLKRRDDRITGKKVVISGSGNVAQYAAKKSIELGAMVLTLSDSNGFIFDPEGIDEEKLAFVQYLKNEKRGRIKEYAEKYGCDYVADERPWSVPCDIALPSATQNELDGDDAQTLVDNGCYVVAEGANMPSTPEAIEVFERNRILYAPGKAANAGGVAVSGLEMSQNSLRYNWKQDKVNFKLKSIMQSIHQSCVDYGEEDKDYVNYKNGCNIAGFVKVADAMIAQGIV